MTDTKNICLRKKRFKKRPNYFFDRFPRLISMRNQYQNWSCILDPMLGLSHYGVLIAENIGKEIELWIVREFWNILNNTKFYTDRPKLVIPKSVSLDSPEEKNIKAEIIWSLNEWQKVREQKDLAKLGLYWLGDNIQESFLPKNKPFNFFGRWESFASALDRQVEQSTTEKDVLTLAFRDTIALAASSGSAFILSYQLPSDFANNVTPIVGRELENWGISCQVINTRNPIVAMERNYLRQLMIRVGLGKLLLAGVHLAIFHLVIPGVSISDTSLQTAQLYSSEHNNWENLDQESYFWSKVTAFWYYL